MQCYIYKSLKKAELYLYIDNKDDFSKVPETLISGLGVPEFVMELELSPKKKLAREDVNKVMASLKDKGFFIQMPPVLVRTPENIQ
jgi:uncharacterized protein YcgL (UPF0745 family)